MGIDIAIYNLIVAERQHQDVKWGANRMLGDYAWHAVLTEETGECAKAILEHSLSLKAEIVQVAAVAIAWLECIQRRET